MNNYIWIGFLMIAYSFYHMIVHPYLRLGAVVFVIIGVTLVSIGIMKHK